MEQYVKILELEEDNINQTIEVFNDKGYTLQSSMQLNNNSIMLTFIETDKLYEKAIRKFTDIVADEIINLVESGIDKKLDTDDSWKIHVGMGPIKRKDDKKKKSDDVVTTE